MTDSERFPAVRAAADTLFERSTIEAAIAAMAELIDDDLDGLPQPLFLTVMQGGLFFAAQLGLYMRTDCEFDYLHATRYHGTHGGGLKWLRHPGTELSGRHVLLVDDILDEGHTLLAVQEYCREQGAASVRIAVLTEKRHDRCAPGIRADYIGLEVPDRYVFGYGMDWNGRGRNIPAILAMAPTA